MGGKGCKHKTDFKKKKEREVCENMKEAARKKMAAVD